MARTDQSTKFWESWKDWVLLLETLSKAKFRDGSPGRETPYCPALSLTPGAWLTFNDRDCLVRFFQFQANLVLISFESGSVEEILFS